ncbi:hypothetical protein DKM44_03225 [Deinococcus irradiatisoli]|uniref:Uncharacterized protein n=1 Tax=Deinococcus irradiatisoli TaxID=2202254 RepID=A0A2Z3JHC6_9DEIO|nr:hypothetical protein [Deinococcus irradiatisoli]AWN22369.1 hypothetical protein DKM44_03225 [Deinococcus irradiatisoli]
MARLNLASLTAEELQHLLGDAAAQRLLPEISSARLAGRAYPGPEVTGELSFEARSERDWGASPEQARALRTLDSDLISLGAAPLGVFYAPQLPGARHQRAYLLDNDTALALRWSETFSGPALPPFIQAVTLSRDRASGIAASMSSTSGLPFSPASSEELDVRLLPGVSSAEFLAGHRNLAARHGRGQKLSGEADWMRAFQMVRQLNFQAWTRRGLLMRD